MGIVLSFVIFVTFLVFLYTTLQPTIESDKDKEVLLDVLKETLVNDISGELIIIPMSIVAYDDPGDCLDFSSSEVSDLGISGKNVIVKKINLGNEEITPASLT